MKEKLFCFSDKDALLYCGVGMLVSIRLFYSVALYFSADAMSWNNYLKDSNMKIIEIMAWILLTLWFAANLMSNKKKSV